MSKTATALKRDLARLRGDAATLYRHYAGAPAFTIELSGLARSVLLSAGSENDVWVRSEIDGIFTSYGVRDCLWLEGDDRRVAMESRHVS